MPKTVIVNQAGVIVNLAGLSQTLINKLSNLFTIRFKPKGRVGQVIIKRNFLKVSAQSTMVIFPRFKFLELLNDEKFKKEFGFEDYNLIIQLPLPEPVGYQIKDFEPRAHQTLIVNYIIENHFNEQMLRSGRSGLTAEVDTGYGKTFIGIELINRLKMPTLIICHNTAQVNDWYNILIKIFGEDYVGIYYSDRKKFAPIMVITIQSALIDEFHIKEATSVMKDRFVKKYIEKNKQKLEEQIAGLEQKIRDDCYQYTYRSILEQFSSYFNTISHEEFFSLFGFLIADESHKYSSDTFRKVFNRGQCWFMLGLSATPDLGVTSAFAEWNIGAAVNMLDKIPALEELKQNFTGDIHVIDYYGPPEYTINFEKKEGENTHLNIIKQIADDPYRIEWFANTIIKLVREGRNIYVFAVILSALTGLRNKIESIVDPENHQIKKRLREQIEELQTAWDEIDKQINRYKHIEKLTKTLSSLTKRSRYKISKAMQKDAQRIIHEIERYKIMPDCTAEQAEYHTQAPSAIKQLVQQLNSITSNGLIGEQMYLNETEYDLLTGGASPERIDQMAKHAKVIFSTYGYLGTGKSIPRMDTIIFYTPHKEGTSQFIGRIFRPGENQAVPRLIIDCVDRGLKLKNQFYTRKKVYDNQRSIGRDLKTTHYIIKYSQIHDPDHNQQYYNQIQGKDRDHDRDRDDDDDQDDQDDDDDGTELPFDLFDIVK